MNPIRFVVAVAVLAFLFPFFEAMVGDCFRTAQRSRGGDAVFQSFLGLLLIFVFLAICVGIIGVATAPDLSKVTP